MHQITSEYKGLQENFREKTRVKSRRRRRITRPFVPLPDGYIGKIPLRLQPMFILLWSLGKGQPVTECYRVLAARLKRDIRTAQQYAYDLQKLGILRIETRKVAWCRNGANTFHFPEFTGFIVEETHGDLTVGVLNPDVNTSTTAPREAREVSYARLRWEHNRFKNHPPAMRKLHEAYAGVREELRRERQGRKAWAVAKREGRRRDALVGTLEYYGFKSVEEAEADWERRQRESAAEAAKWAEEARQLREREAARRAEVERVERERRAEAARMAEERRKASEPSDEELEARKMRLSALLSRKVTPKWSHR